MQKQKKGRYVNIQERDRSEVIEQEGAISAIDLTATSQRPSQNELGLVRRRLLCSDGKGRATKAEAGK